MPSLAAPAAVLSAAPLIDEIDAVAEAPRRLPDHSAHARLHVAVVPVAVRRDGAVAVARHRRGHVAAATAEAHQLVLLAAAAAGVGVGGRTLLHLLRGHSNISSTKSWVFWLGDNLILDNNW